MLNLTSKVLIVICLIWRVKGTDEKCILNECTCSFVDLNYYIECKSEANTPSFNQIIDSNVRLEISAIEFAKNLIYS